MDTDSWQPNSHISCIHQHQCCKSPGASIVLHNHVEYFPREECSGWQPGFLHSIQEQSSQDRWPPQQRSFNSTKILGSWWYPGIWHKCLGSCCRLITCYCCLVLFLLQVDHILNTIIISKYFSVLFMGLSIAAVIFATQTQFYKVTSCGWAVPSSGQA